jgi:hypothetical protein
MNLVPLATAQVENYFAHQLSWLIRLTLIPEHNGLLLTAIYSSVQHLARWQ